MTEQQHPYYPRDLELPGFVPGTWSRAEIFGIFGTALALVVLISWNLSGKFKHLTQLDRRIICWWAVTGAIHFLQEGAFVVSPKFYASTTNDYFSEGWKEYSKADSRYASRDPCIVSIEAVTAFVEGPLCFVIIYALVTLKPYRHILQFAVALGQVYGTIIYFGTSYLEGFKHSDPGFLYFWLYFVAMNGIWILIPGLIIIRTWNASVAVVGHIATSTNETKSKKRR